MRADNFKETQIAKLRVAFVLVAIFSVLSYWDDIRDWMTGMPRGSLLLFASAASHDLRGIDRALAQGADINARSPMDLTALHYACDSGDDAMVKALLDRGADANADAQHILIPLHNAVCSRNERSVALLLAAGGNPNVIHGDQTVLDLAEAYDCPAIVALLRDHGAKRAAELRAGV